jgi:hypothetical protein
MSAINTEVSVDHTVDLYKAAEILWEVLPAWAALRPRHDPIHIPEIEVLDDYEFTYDTLRENVHGTFSEYVMTVTVLTGLHGHALMTTLLHELAHLVQYEDNKGNFTRHYDLMNERFGYDNNPYEVDARNTFKAYHSYLIKHPEFRDKVWAVLGRD